MSDTDDLLARASSWIPNCWDIRAEQLIRALVAEVRRLRHTTAGPCGDTAEVPQVHVRCVQTPDGPKVEIGMISNVYCWRVRSWWTPDAASLIADDISRAVLASTDQPTPDTGHGKDRS